MPILFFLISRGRSSLSYFVARLNKLSVMLYELTFLFMDLKEVYSSFSAYLRILGTFCSPTPFS